MTAQSLKMALSSIMSNKMRSFLTMLGIIIGVLALVVLVSLVDGASNSVYDQISGLGTDLLSVNIFDDKGNPLKLSDIEDIARNPDIDLVAPVRQMSTTVKYAYTTKSATVNGTTSDYGVIQGVVLERGRFLKTTDVENSSYVVVVDHRTAVDLFGRTDVLGETIILAGRNFRIVGVLEESNSMMSMIYGRSVYIPITVESRLSGKSAITSFSASSTDPNSMDEAEKSLKRMLMQRFRQDENAFMVFNQSMIMDAMAEVTNTLSLLLGGIAAISLLVGGIGIMNIMLVSVTERTKEIGIRKAIGASRGSIMLQFLIEALVISLIGCVIGIILSGVILQIVTAISADMLNFVLSPRVVITAVSFSLAIGLIFGLYPANKASSQPPIEALRYAG